MTLLPAKTLLKRQLRLCLNQEGSSQACAVQTPNLVKYLSDYLNCRQFLDHEAFFADQVKQLQVWQAQRVRATHFNCLNNPLQRQAAEFVLLDAYEQLDMVSLAPQLSRLVRYAERLFPQPLLHIADLAFAVNLLTAQMDQAIAHVLFEQMGIVDINEADYIKAFLSVGGVAFRQQQLTLILTLTQALDRQARNKKLLIAFKLAKAPAYAAGFRALYSFMAMGLDALRSLPDAVQMVEQIVAIEFDLNDAIASGSSYSLLRQA